MPTTYLCWVASLAFGCRTSCASSPAPAQRCGRAPNENVPSSPPLPLLPGTSSSSSHAYPLFLLQTCVQTAVCNCSTSKTSTKLHGRERTGRFSFDAGLPGRVARGHGRSSGVIGRCGQKCGWWWWCIRGLPATWWWWVSIHGTFHHLDWIDGVTLGACEWSLDIVRSGTHTRCERILGCPATWWRWWWWTTTNGKWWWWHEDPREGHTTSNTRPAGPSQFLVWLAAVENERDGRWKQGFERGGKF